jgi:twitching motility two-component system response regulator PilH
VARVLIADDNPDLVAILSGRFRTHGFEVLEAKDGAEAMELIRAKRPDVAVLDVMMPELNGYQVCRSIREDAGLADIRVVLLTAKDSDADKFWGAEVGADLYLTKPVEPASVVAHVQGLLARP